MPKPPPPPPFPPNLRELPANWTARLLTIFAVGAGLGLGTCGLSLAINAHPKLSTSLLGIGAYLFFGSVAGLLLTILALALAAVFRLFRR